jgi:hypothetical protein
MVSPNKNELSFCSIKTNRKILTLSIRRLHESDESILGGWREQGCQMFCFQTKNPNLGKFSRFSDWNRLIYFMDIRNIFWTSGILSDHVGHWVFIWYIFSCFGVMNQEKSGNPDVATKTLLHLQLQLQIHTLINVYTVKAHTSTFIMHTGLQVQTFLCTSACGLWILQWLYEVNLRN